MATVMTAAEFVAKAKDIATNYKTLYVMGCFGAPMTAANKKRYIAHNPYNAQTSRVKCINAATTDTFGFDCVCLIKGILWGWNGDKTKSYGGAKYAVKGVQDINADQMIAVCEDVSADFSKIAVGEALWCKGHIGIYIGDGLAVECTPSWKNRVQITAVRNIATKEGYNARKWTKHGKLPYIDYTKATTKKPSTTSQQPKTDVAQHRNVKLTGSYKVTATALNIRAGADAKKTSLGILKKDAVVQNFGYYSVNKNGTKWLYVKTADGTVGFCSMRYLKKC